MENNSENNFLTKYYEMLDKSRGQINYNNYGAYIFSLFFLRYINCEFNLIYMELVEEGGGFEEDIDVYASEDIFYVPTNARWDYIVENATSEYMGLILDSALRTIEKYNNPLKNLSKELKFKFLMRLVNGKYNINSIIWLINSEETQNNDFWFKILKRIYKDLIRFDETNKYIILEDIMEYLEQKYNKKNNLSYNCK